MCCSGTPAYMHAATAPPPGLSGFSPVRSDDLEVWFRAPAGRRPDVLEIGLRGRRPPPGEAYWDACAFVLGAAEPSLGPGDNWPSAATCGSSPRQTRFRPGRTRQRHASLE